MTNLASDVCQRPCDFSTTTLTTTTTVGSGADPGISIAIDFGMISEIGKFVGISSSLIWKRQIIYLRYLEKGLKNKAYILNQK